MKKLFIITVSLFFCINIFAQKDTTGFVFTTVKENKITSIKNQNRSSTCWAFSGLGFLEAELLRLGKGEHDFAEMFVVYHTMLDRAQNYVRLHGESSYSPGGSFYDALYCWKTYGMVPQSAMNGIMYGDTLHVHNELDKVAGAYVDAIAKGDWKKLTPVWQNGLSAIYDTYLGKLPENFDYNGKKYSPRTFADSFGLNIDDYISLTSYSHHPFYSTFAIEVADNWRMAQSYNLPLDEFMQTIEYAVNQGFTVAWASDVSEIGFTRTGVAVMPDADKGAEITGSDMAHWTGLTAADKKTELTTRPLPEIEVTQALRQKAFDNWESTDDHGMLIYGIANDQNGKPYFLVKNSWGKAGKYDGIWYASKAFVAYKTINIIVHKNSIPKEILKKLGIK
ncbi:MAG: aminopeptidase [Prevotellaceae bacterium]|jgi:aminopeptidase C|nr:aminopeptidase [Prevotellaceae bacterium]